MSTGACPLGTDNHAVGPVGSPVAGGQAPGDGALWHAAATDKPDLSATNETEAEWQRRLAWERERIAEADADIAAALIIDAAEIDAWIDSIGTDHELPPPQARR